MKTEPWFYTYSGIKFQLLDPTMDMINIHDIAHSLSMQCRWNGHCKFFYSVAEHSFHVSNLVPKSLALHGLLHDAAEAYVGDIITPYKDQLVNAKTIEHKILKLIFECFGVANTLDDKHIVKLFDGQMIPTEAFQIVPFATEYKWLEAFPHPAKIDLECWKSSVAKAVFLDRFNTLLNINENGTMEAA